MEKKSLKVVYILIAILAIFNIINSALILSNKSTSNKQTNTPLKTSQSSLKIDSDVTKLVDEVYESVVTIALYDQDNNLLGNGSGSIISNEDGVLNIVTNNHVVDTEGVNEIRVLFASNEQVSAKVLGRDAISDLALLEAKVDFDVKALPIGDSDVLQVGEPIIAIGSPLDISYTGSVTDGIISGLDRTIKIDTTGNGVEDYAMNVIQTNASINPGNSGGPLINMAGQMIGINTIKIVQSGFEGMGFAIPSNEALAILEQLKENGKVERPLLGINYQPVSNITDYAREKYNIPSDIQNGLFIREVIADTPAAKAKIQKNDIIIGINGTKISDLTIFTKVLYNSKKGDVIELLVLRDGEEITIKVTL
ncbi:MAG: S1C family serine protease [Bacilli bacterium]